MDLSLKGKVAIVTGASRGIGAQIVYELARRGAKVSFTYTSDSSEKNATELVTKVHTLANGSAATAIKTDLRDVTAPAALVNSTVTVFDVDHVDILIDNAGCELVKPISSITTDDYSHVYDLNVRGTFLMTKAVIPYLRAHG